MRVPGAPCGTIGFAQAAALVIGFDVGTTVTAAIAAVGGTTATQRTALAHVVFNLMTAAMALILPTAGIHRRLNSSSGRAAPVPR